MRKKWDVKKESGNPIVGLEDGGFHPVVLRLLANRGITEADGIRKFFDFNYDSDVHSPFLFSDMEKAMARMARAKEGKEKLAIFGDYDADGVTATALMYETLTNLGFTDVIPYIPGRQTEGYGMNEAAIEYLSKEGVSLIITVDCGVTNVAQTDKAKSLGVDVIITDHHYVPKELPQAVAIINPHMENCGYPFADLAGVGVAFKFAEALYRKFDAGRIDQLKWLLDLVAIGTVADCVPLIGENRVLAKYGLVVLSKTRRAGLLEMFKVGRIAIDENNIPDTQKIGFQIAPRINAAGRMDHASMAYDLLIEKDTVRARDMALEIEDKNKSRQKVTTEIVREVRALAENSFKERKLIFAANEHWQVGILGLIAGRVAEEFNKPTAVFQKRETEFVGSFRSIDQVNIVKVLEQCSDLLIRFGGHSQAAGAQVAPENMDKFYEKMSAIIEKQLENKDITPTITIDLEVGPQDIDWDLVGAINKLQPFGEGNEEPVFIMKDLSIADMKVVGNGSKHLKLSLRAQDGPRIFEAIGFRLGENELGLEVGEMVDIVFNLQEDEWNGNKKMQLNLVDIRRK
ncbi:MAG: single-stranded-DNA-specific exonuclease RecJ [Candidatus Moranbacteria bacterium]|nr:single-stranded-DNA-specific exonuclease RecJ [Candidatus Moranbacteria bacterium]MDZ4384995.1 single-stranded-DNA-specific exonuclease RecJ [Candidatus Moranbacteria bacterium]